MRFSIRLVACLALLAGRALAGQDTHAAGHAHAKQPVLGTVAFANSGNAAAQEPFLRGIALLHSFEYEDAAAAFREAQRVDPALAVAYWAEALTYSHVLWRSEDLDASRAALARLGPTAAERLARAKTERERSFGAAVEAFYREGSLAARVRAYADSLRSHARRAPDDQEGEAFAAHAIMLASYFAERPSSDSLAREAIALAQRVARANPNHPGATHYLIHLYDTPGMAADGLEFARAYDKIAPDAEHALHMPSHIYLQLGMWDDVVRSNERAWAASRARQDAARADWHAYSWLQYAYLQQGRFRDARALVDSARRILASARSSYPDANVVVPRLEFQYASETGNWRAGVSAPRNSETPAISDRDRGFRLFAGYWRAVDAVMRGASDMAVVAERFAANADSLRAAGMRSPVMAANALVVRALAARAKGDTARFTALIAEAAGLERTLSAFVGPPERVFALELLGEELARSGRHAEAARAYDDVLRICPRRSRALLGAYRAKLAGGDATGATDVLALILQNFAGADPAVLEGLR